MAITTGNEQISQKWDQIKAGRDKERQEKKDASEAEKNGAVSAFEDAWDNANKNDADTLGGAIAEGAKDIWTALGATVNAGWEIVEDAITDAGLDLGDKIQDTQDGASETFEKAGNMGGNILNGIKNVFAKIGEAFEEGTNKGHTEEA